MKAAVRAQAAIMVHMLPASLCELGRPGFPSPGSVLPAALRPIMPAWALSAAAACRCRGPTFPGAVRRLAPHGAASQWGARFNETAAGCGVGGLSRRGPAAGPQRAFAPPSPPARAVGRRPPGGCVRRGPRGLGRNAPLPAGPACAREAYPVGRGCSFSRHRPTRPGRWRAPLARPSPAR